MIDLNSYARQINTPWGSDVMVLKFICKVWRRMRVNLSCLKKEKWDKKDFYMI